MKLNAWNEWVRLQGCHKAVTEHTQAELDRIKRGHLGPLLGDVRDEEIVVRVRAHEKELHTRGGIPGAQARAKRYAEARARVWAEWDALPEAKRTKRGFRTTFAHDVAEKHRVTPKIINAWIAKRP